MRVFQYIKRRRTHLNHLFENNAESVSGYNRSIFKITTLMGIAVMIIPIFFSPFSEGKKGLIPIYLFCTVLLLCVYFLSNREFFKPFFRLGLYLLFTTAFLFSIYLSVFDTNTHRAAVIVGVFSIFPMCIVDKPYRLLLFSVFFYIVHTYLSFRLKVVSLAIDDAVNCFCFLVLGNAIGERMLLVRLEAFETRRLLTVEKETDELTGLNNRRKLFQMIGEFESGDGELPSGVIMMDIDDFKTFNDRYGHTEGDKLLNRFGNLLSKYEDTYSLSFFRYGGEEFAAFAWDYDLQELVTICEKINESVSKMNGYHREIKVSIGVTDCGKNFKNYEKYIELADMALYRAKSEGKNRVICFDENLDHAPSTVSKPDPAATNKSIL